MSETIDWNTVARDHMLATSKDKAIPMSQTQIKSMNTCSLKWYLDYIMKYRKHTVRTFEMDHGKDFHTHAEYGFNNMRIEENEVIMFPDEYMDTVSEEHHEALYWLEDWMNTKLKQSGEVPKIFKMEWELYAPPEEIGGSWIQRMGFVDMAWLLPDGTLFLWEFKTGDDMTESGNVSSKVNNSFKQLYYYKGIVERIKFTVPPEYLHIDGKDQLMPAYERTYKVSGVGVIYPETKNFYRRLDRTVPKGTKNTSRISARSIKTIEKTLKESIEKIVTLPIEAKYDGYYCAAWCPYASEDHQVCDFEQDQDLTKFIPVSSQEELIELGEIIMSDW